MYAFVEEAEALNLSTYRVYDEQLLRVYTEAVLASQAGAQQLQCPRVLRACRLDALLAVVVPLLYAHTHSDIVFIPTWGRSLCVTRSSCPLHSMAQRTRALSYTYVLMPHTP